MLKLEQPSLNTTKHLIQEISSRDLVIHVGDLSYADGYEAGVSTINLTEIKEDNVKLCVLHLVYLG